MGELLLILIVALLVVGPDKLPNAARSIGKGIRDFRRHTQDLQSTIEQDEHIGGAMRELRSALRDEPSAQRMTPRTQVGQGQDGEPGQSDPGAIESDAAQHGDVTAPPTASGNADEQAASGDSLLVQPAEGTVEKDRKVSLPRLPTLPKPRSSSATKPPPSDSEDSDGSAHG